VHERAVAGRQSLRQCTNHRLAHSPNRWHRQLRTAVLCCKVTRVGKGGYWLSTTRAVGQAPVARPFCSPWVTQELSLVSLCHVKASTSHETHYGHGEERPNRTFANTLQRRPLSHITMCNPFVICGCIIWASETCQVASNAGATGQLQLFLSRNSRPAGCAKLRYEFSMHAS
jgi:hypothetical protein